MKRHLPLFSYSPSTLFGPSLGQHIRVAEGRLEGRIKQVEALVKPYNPGSRALPGRQFRDSQGLQPPARLESPGAEPVHGVLADAVAIPAPLVANKTSLWHYTCTTAIGPDQGDDYVRWHLLGQSRLASPRRSWCGRGANC
jgi:hypothetical protein